MAASQDNDPRNLHDLAVDAQTDIQKLAVGLAHAGASPQAVAQLTKMGTILSQVVKVLAEGPSLDNAQQGQGPPPPGAGAPPGQPPAGGPPQAGPGQVGPPAPGPAAPAPQHAMHAAAHSLHAAMVASAQARNGQ